MKKLLAIIPVILLIGGLFYYTSRQLPQADHGAIAAQVETPRTIRPMEMKTYLYSQLKMLIEDKGQKHELTYFWLDAKPALAKNHDPKKTYPLVVILHGSTGNAYAGIYLAEEPLRSRYPAFIMVPTIPEKTVWAFPESVPLEFEKQLKNNVGQRQMLPYIVTMIEKLMAAYPIDPKRVYVVGCSLGGFGAFGAARDYPDLFAAAVSISGGWTPEDSQKLTKIPLLAIHGKLDDNVPAGFSRDVTSLINEYGGHALYTELPEMGHECPSATLYGDVLWSWVFKQHK